MDREDRNRKQNDGRNTRERNEGANQESEANANLSGDCDPGHDVRHRNTRRLKNPGEHFWSPRPFRQAVRQESITYNQSKEGQGVGRKPLPCLPPTQPFRRATRHFSLQCPDAYASWTDKPKRDRTSSSMSASLLEARNGPTT